MAKKTLYSHFSSKEDLVLKALEKDTLSLFSGLKLNLKKQPIMTS
ncbi:hypothetical protein JCM19240_5583 [Vibrio maritimus]|uniref:Uncharacterized protein n=1 Tax=Vibrio maritimus TaxID=990268 RepID=A0A090TLG8_9VIBR|nr:hypothetical protein JCM19240_5583 [Vibrio maritimus]